jgi:ornithine decarboxylase
LLYNETEARRKLGAWKKALPWIKPHYAIKSNPAMPLLNDFHANGASFDCASRAELESVMSVGASKEDIVYSNPIKDESDLTWAENNGVKYTTADSIDELFKIKELAPSMEVLWRISIKEEACDNLSTPFSGKFGDDIDSEEKIHTRMQQIQQMGVKLKGIHFHCGSGQHGSSAFGRAVNLARKCLEIGRAYDH